MRRGTTPTHTFTLPDSVDVSLIFSSRVVYAQNGNVVVKKEGDDIAMNGSALVVKLTQEETLRFSDQVEAEVQLRILTTGGDALVSSIRPIPVERCLDDEVLA